MRPLIDRARRLAGRPRVRRLLTRPGVERFVALFLRSGVVRPGRLRFVARELLGRRVVRTYRLRDGLGAIVVRHGTPDVVTLDEIFLTGDYRLPESAEAALRSAPGPLRALDLGANAGYFCVFLLDRFPEARIVAFEPDADNAEILRATIAANAAGDRCEIVEACAAVRDGTAQFVSGGYSLSRLLAAGEPPGVSATVQEVPTVDVLPLFAEADLLKIDIEGGEWELLMDSRFRDTSARAVVLEYHPMLAPRPDPHEVAREALITAGFLIETIWQRDDGHGVVWGWKPT